MPPAENTGITFGPRQWYSREEMKSVLFALDNLLKTKQGIGGTKYHCHEIAQEQPSKYSDIQLQ